jgi:hypothetical protein
LKKQLELVNIEVEKKTQVLNAQIQEWKDKLEMTKVQMSNTTQLPIKMQNMLKEFEELLLDNTLLKIQNQVLGDKNRKWEWWQIV